MIKRRLLTCTALVGAVALAVPSPAPAAEITVPQGTTDTAEKEVAGTDRVIVERGATLDTEDEAIAFDTAAAATDVVIDNAGIIQSSKERAIRAKYDDDDGLQRRTVTLTNRQGAAIRSEVDDAIQFQENADGSHIRIDNAGTIEAGDGQALDLGGAQGVDLSNAASGLITSREREAIKADVGLTLDNAGTIRSVEDRAILIDETDDANTVSIVNRAGGLIVAEDADTIKVDKNGDGSTVVIDNAGTIRSGDSQALDLSGAKGVTVTNRGGGVITARAGDAVRTGIGTVFHNYGTIRAETIGDGDGIDTRDTDDTGSSIVNHAGGLISGGKHGVSGGDGDDFGGAHTVTVTNQAGATIIGRAGSGVGLDDNGKVVNYGTITGAWDGTYMGDPADGPDERGVDGDGVDIDQHAEILNYGLIEGTGATGKKDGQTNHSEGVAAGGGVIRNFAGATIRGYHAGILIDDGNDGSAMEATTIVNAGTIEGRRLYAIKLVGAFDDTLTTSGTISAGPEAAFAVDMGDGDDTVTVNGGRITGGALVGGAGTDSLTFFDGVTGTFTFDHDITGFEATRVRAGTVHLRGALESTASVTVDRGAALRVDRAFTTGDLTVNGTFQAAAEASPRVVTVTGDYAQGRDGVLEIGIDGQGGRADRLAVTGTAALADGATLRPVSSGYVADGAAFDILTASDLTVDASALTLDGGSLLLDWSVTEADDGLVLTAARTESFASLSGAPAGATLDALAPTATGDMRTVLQTLERLPSAGALREAMAEVSPTPNGATLNAVTAAAGAAAGTIQGRMGAVRAGARGTAGPASFALATPDTTGAAAHLLAGSGRDREVDGLPVLGVMSGGAPAGSGLWAQAFGTAGLQGARNGTEGFKSRGVGVAIGGDMPLSDDSLIGVAATYARTFVDGRGAQAEDESTIDSYQLTVYGSRSFDAFFVDGQAAVARNRYDTTRGLPALGRVATADYDGWQGLAKVTAGRDVALDAGTLTPTASVQYAHTSMDGYTETGAGAISRTVDSQDYDTVTTALGARLALPAVEVDAGVLTPVLSGSLSYDVVADRQHVTAAFVGGGGAFETDGAKPARAGVSAGLGVSYRAGNVDLDAGYELELREKYQGHAALLRLRYAL